MRIESGGSIKAVVPEVGVAGGDGHSGVVAMVDGEGQRVGTGATISIGIVECIYAGSSIGGAIPRVVVADGFGIDVVGATVNSQVESNDAIAANGIEN